MSREHELINACWPAPADGRLRPQAARCTDRVHGPGTALSGDPRGQRLSFAFSRSHPPRLLGISPSRHTRAARRVGKLEGLELGSLGQGSDPTGFFLEDRTGRASPSVPAIHPSETQSLSTISTNPMNSPLYTLGITTRHLVTSTATRVHAHHSNDPNHNSAASTTRLHGYIWPSAIAASQRLHPCVLPP